MPEITATPLRSDTGEVFVRLPAAPGPAQLLPLRSRIFRNYLIASLEAEHARIPRPATIKRAIRALQSQAADQRPVHISLRVAMTGNSTLLDLHNPAGEAVEITSRGWRITSDHTAHFRTTQSARPLPAPETGGDLNNFRTLLSLTPDDFTRCLSWLTAALSPTGPYPILFLQGRAASAKSAIASMLRALIDPGAAPFCPLPRSNRDINSLTAHNWIIALEHIDLLSRATLKKLALLSQERPMIFTSASILPLTAIRISLPAESQTPSQQNFHYMRPQILGALYNAVVANSTVPWQTFTNALDPIAVAIAKHLETAAKWTGTATGLLLHLRAIDPTTPWPATPKGLTQLLRRTPIPNIAFHSHKGSGGKRSVTLGKTAPSNLCADAPQTPKTKFPIRVNSCSFVAQASALSADALPLAKIGFPP